MSRVIFTPRFSVLYLFMLSSVLYDSAQSLYLKEDPSKDFSRHKIVQPIVYHARTKRQLHSTRYTEGLHHPDVTMMVPVDGEEYILDLTLNERLVTDGHIISYKQDGKIVLIRPTREKLDICQYSGSVRNKPGSWAAVSTCHGVEGVICDGQHMSYIHPAQEADNLTRIDHYMYNTSYSCGNNDSMDNLVREKNSENMDSVANVIKGPEIHGPFNPNPSSRYVELVMVADYGLYQKYDNNITKVHSFMKNLVNMANSYFAPVNIFLALKAVVVWSDGDEITAEEGNNTAILGEFLEYRRSHLNTILKNDHAFLITCKAFEEDVLGISSLEGMCTDDKSGSVAHYEVNTALLATTVAHEIGHSIGLKHNHEYGHPCCFGPGCIMDARASDPEPAFWSECSLKELPIAANKRECLRNKPTSLFESPTCGNGFLEPGEQCDCGLDVDVMAFHLCRFCCDKETCKLRPECAGATGDCYDINSSMEMEATVLPIDIV